MSTPALEVSGLNKRFGGLPATKNVSFQVMAGERRLIIGPNGAGKTTMFNLVTGDLTPDSGSVKLFGRELMGMPTQDRVHLGLARTYQILTLFPRETLLHNVVLALLGLQRLRWDPWAVLTGHRHLYAAAGEALAKVGLADSAERVVAETSYGERRRLELAMALAQQPKLLLLDEDYIRTAFAKGLAPSGVLVRHALKNASLPIVTIIGIGFALLIGGAVVTESVFALPGLGRLTVDAIVRRDYPVIQGVLLVVSGAYVMINLIVDVLYVVLDPRIRY